jgi:septum formation protein
MLLIVLASGSPRRREMIGWTGWDFIQHPVDVDERPAPDEPPDTYVSRLAETKAAACASAHSGNDIILAADTTVADGGLILGKPVDPGDARRMLQRLRGRTHQVFTALAVYQVTSSRWLYDRCCSQVPMRSYSDQEIETYIASGDPIDKAGAYAIQNKSFHPVADFSGCFANVMGLPLCHLVRTMRQIGIEAPLDVAQTCQSHLDYDCPVYRDVQAGHDIG